MNNIQLNALMQGFAEKMAGGLLAYPETGKEWLSLEPYHFESSDRYMNINKIRRAESMVRKKKNLNQRDSRQLKSIVKLEKLRYGLAQGKTDLQDYQSAVQKEVRSFTKDTGFNVFGDTDAHEKFYYYLNTL